MRFIRQSADEIYFHYLSNILSFTGTEATLAETYILQESHILTTDLRIMEDLEGKIEECYKKIHAKLEKFEETLEGEEVKSFNEYKTIIREIFVLNDTIISLSHAQKTEEAEHLSRGDFKDLYTKANLLGRDMLEGYVQGADQYHDESDKDFITMMWFLSLSLIFITIFLFFIGRNLTANIVRPVKALNHAMQNMAAGHLQTKIQMAPRHDEIGDMSKTLQNFQKKFLNQQKSDQQRHEDTEARAQRAVEIERASQSFELRAQEILSLTTHANQDMQQTVQTLRQTSDDALESTEDVDRATHNANHSIELVAAAAEELSASISEIAQQVHAASHISTQAVSEGEKANTAIKSLATASARIHDVVSLIQDVAAQTNLLALNATKDLCIISALRASDFLVG